MKPIPIFVGYDKRERAATNVLIDSLYQNSKIPLNITPLVTSQLQNLGIYKRDRDPKQSTDFSFTRFLVPYLMNYDGWAIFMDCDMLCKKDISQLWNLRDDKYSVMCVKHKHEPKEGTKFQNEKQTPYPKKNWSSLMLFNCKKCHKLKVDYVNTASGLDLHRFNWLENDNEIGSISIKDGWNFLVGVQHNNDNVDLSLIHWTLGGPWFREERLMGKELSAEWFSAREDAFKLWT